jgi:hypothetical protein
MGCQMAGSKPQAYNSALSDKFIITDARKTKVVDIMDISKKVPVGQKPKSQSDRQVTVENVDLTNMEERDPYILLWLFIGMQVIGIVGAGIIGIIEVLYNKKTDQTITDIETDIEKENKNV